MDNKEKLYVLFSCNTWKEHSSMGLMGVFSENQLRKKIKKEVLANNFEIDDEIYLTEGAIEKINDRLKYGYIESIYLNEEI